MKELLPGVPHRYCVKHLFMNLSKRWRGTELKAVFWATCKCTTDREFEANMEKLKQLNENAWLWMSKFPKSTWSRAGFRPESKNEAVVNNACEQFNAAIVKCRSKPIITMAESIRQYLMQKLIANREEMKKYSGPLCPRVQTKLEKNKLDSVHWTPIWAGDPDGCIFEVECRPRKVVVDLKKATCTCRRWDLSGIPCKHAVAALGYNNWEAEKFVHPWLTKEVFFQVYSTFIQPTAGEEFWTKTDRDPLDPPIIKRPPGRPKRSRTKAPEEAQDPYRLKRSCGPVTCSKCKLQGHNARSCKGAPSQPNKKPRKPHASTESNEQEDDLPSQHEPTAHPTQLQLSGPAASQQV